MLDVFFLSRHLVKVRSQDIEAKKFEATVQRQDVGWKQCKVSSFRFFYFHQNVDHFLHYQSFSENRFFNSI